MTHYEHFVEWRMLGDWPILGQEERVKVSVEGTIDLDDYLNTSFLLVGVECSTAIDARGVDPQNYVYER